MIAPSKGLSVIMYSTMPEYKITYYQKANLLKIIMVTEDELVNQLTGNEKQHMLLSCTIVSDLFRGRSLSVKENKIYKNKVSLTVQVAFDLDDCTPNIPAKIN